MFTIGLALSLRANCYDEYKNAHDDLWPEISQSMKNNNISMIIYRIGNRLVIFGVAPSEKDWNHSRTLPIVDKWNAYMATLLETDKDGNSIFEELSEAFSFGMFGNQT